MGKKKYSEEDRTLESLQKDMESLKEEVKVLEEASKKLENIKRNKNTLSKYYKKVLSGIKEDLGTFKNEFDKVVRFHENNNPYMMHTPMENIQHRNLKVRDILESKKDSFSHEGITYLIKPKDNSGRVFIIKEKSNPSNSFEAKPEDSIDDLIKKHLSSKVKNTILSMKSTVDNIRYGISILSSEDLKDLTNKEFYNYHTKEKFRTSPIDRNRYTDLSHEGLEGPFLLESGKVVYYDPKEGKYYDRDSDMYMDMEDYMTHRSNYEKKAMEYEEDKSLSGIDEDMIKNIELEFPLSGGALMYYFDLDSLNFNRFTNLLNRFPDRKDDIIRAVQFVFNKYADINGLKEILLDRDYKHLYKILSTLEPILSKTLKTLLGGL